MASLQIGLTGGIGSGKSTVAKALVSLGAVLVDTDAIAHSITAPGGRAIPALIKEFGSDVVDASGAMDRNRMRAIAFADPAAKARLEGVLHPLIGAVAQEQALAAAGRTVVFDVPLLTEHSRWRAQCGRIVVVDCSEATQLARVMQRNGWDEAAVRRVISLQTPRRARRLLADAVIFNDGLELAALHAQAAALLHHWKA
jgi:dephospho-CoA kinase